MDDGLAYCLDRFIDDQGELMDKRIEVINQKEVEECRRIEAAKREADKKKPPPRNKGFHDQDKALVDRLLRDLDGSANNTPSRTVINDPGAIDALRAEILTKVGACSKYIARLRNLAQPLPNTKSFVQSCNEAIDLCRRTDHFEESFRQFCTILSDSDEDNFVRETQKWWKSAYGTTIAKLNERNSKINRALTEDQYGTVSPTSRIATNARTLLAARKIEFAEPPKSEIIRQFVQRHLALDEELQKKMDPDSLIERLNIEDNNRAISYAQQWLRNRDEVRNEKEQPDPYDQQLSHAKADFGRQRLAQEAKKLALAALLCRLAVGPGNDNRFEQKLQKTVEKQNQSNGESLAVISGDIKEPEVEELPLVIQLRMDEGEMERWGSNSNSLRERFAAALCKAFGIPEKQINVDDVELTKGVIHLIVRPPYGKNVVDSLNGNAEDAASRMAAVRQCCLDLDAHVESITLGEFGLQVENRLMDARWNKKYVRPEEVTEDTHYWATPIDQGGKPYFCPSGWKRYGVKVAEDAAEFDAKWGSWHVAYHGTRGEHASSILISGLRVSSSGCFFEEGIPRVYVSPSIEYSAHPRYAFPWKQSKKNGKDIWYQLIFQCRVNPASVERIGPETLLPQDKKGLVQIDANFTNDILEWVILAKQGIQYIRDDIICYGLMMRTSPVDPDTLPASKWWKSALFSDVYKNPQ